MYDLAGRWTPDLLPPGVDAGQLVVRVVEPTAAADMLARVAKAISAERDRAARHHRIATDEELAVAVSRAARELTAAMIEAALRVRLLVLNSRRSLNRAGRKTAGCG
jgi:hypothetical protein